MNTSNVDPHTDASAWEHEHVTEVTSENSGFAHQPSRAPPPPTFQPQQQTQALRETDLHDTRQRIEALEAEREEQEVAQALATSAADAHDPAVIEEHLQQQIHQAHLLLLNAWEKELRWKVQGQQ